jgi:hypothetical protein
MYRSYAGLLPFPPLTSPPFPSSVIVQLGVRATKSTETTNNCQEKQKNETKKT